MKTLRVLVCTLLLVAVSSYGVAADSKGKSINVNPVDVPEKILLNPTPEEIHADAPPDQRCDACHKQGSLDAEPKPTNHFLTTKDCGTCHFNKSWVPLRNYSHMSGKYSCLVRVKPDVSPDDCKGCHIGNIEYQAPALGCK